MRRERREGRRRDRHSSSGRQDTRELLHTHMQTLPSADTHEQPSDKRATLTQKARVQTHKPITQTHHHTDTHTHIYTYIHTHTCIICTYDETKQIAQRKTPHKANHPLLIGQAGAQCTDFIRRTLLLGTGQNIFEGVHGVDLVAVCVCVCVCVCVNNGIRT